MGSGLTGQQFESNTSDRKQAPAEYRRYQAATRWNFRERSPFALSCESRARSARKSPWNATTLSPALIRISLLLIFNYSNWFA